MRTYEKKSDNDFIMYLGNGSSINNSVSKAKKKIFLFLSDKLYFYDISM